MRKVLSLFLALTMVFMMVPSVAYASSVAPLELVKTVGDGTATLTLNTTSDFEMSALDFTINIPEGCTITSVSQGSDYAETGAGAPSNKGTQVSVLASQFNSATTVPAGKEFFVIVVNTSGASSADLTFSITITAAANFDDVAYAWQGATITAVSKNTSTTGYTANLTTSSASNEVNGGTQITVNVGVSHSKEATFNAGEIKLSYDSSLLTPDKTYIQETLKLAYKLGTGDDGKALLTIEDFGTDKDMDYTYGIPFNAVTVDQDTETSVALTDARFVDKADATTKDLEKATITNSPIDITIKVPMVKVTLTEKDTTNTTETTTEKGKEYTFTPADTNNYTYSEVTATVGGQNVTVTPSTDGKSFTIAGTDVTGDIELTYTKNANTYDVTTKYVNEDGEELSTSTDENAAAYNTLFKFTVDADVEAGANVGYTYTLTSVTINGVDYTGYSCAQGTKDYTIPGADISGDIVITIEKEEIPANTYTVTVDGEAIGDATVEKSPITQDETAKITVTVDPGYTYTVTATMSGNPAEVVQAGNVYTVANVTGNVVFTVNKTLDTTSVKVYDYATVQNNKIWLVIYDGTLAPAKAPAYDGATMFWSDKYDAYCYLVIAATMDDATAQGKVTAGTATATDVDYNMDINNTGIKDAADAQVVWNMYNAVYNNFTDMEMAKFLAADLNATSTDTSNWKINVLDAEVIVNYILTNS